MPNLRCMRTLVSALLTALVVGAAPGPAVADTPVPEEIVLRGDRSASVEVRLRHPVDLKCCRLRAEAGDGPRSYSIAGFDVETSGSYAGFAIERVRDGRIMKGAVRIPEMDLADGTVPTFASFGRVTKLRPGRYRIHLLTDGRSTVRVAAPGLRDQLELTPAGPTGASAELVPLLTESGPQQVQARVPLEVPRDATVVLVGKTEGDFGQFHYLGQCLVQPGGQCSDEDHYETWASPASGSSGGTKIDVFDGSVEAGSYDAVFVAGSAGVPQGAYGFVLVLS